VCYPALDLNPTHFKGGFERVRGIVISAFSNPPKKKKDKALLSLINGKYYLL